MRSSLFFFPLDLLSNRLVIFAFASLCFSTANGAVCVKINSKGYLIRNDLCECQCV